MRLTVKKVHLPRLDFAFANSYEATPHAWIVPFERNPRFTGRESQLTKLEKILFTGDQTTKTAITGLGRVGKTQPGLELAHRVQTKQKNCSIIWILATNRESLEQAYLASLNSSAYLDGKTTRQM